MAESSVQSFEQMDIAANQGIRPEKDLSPQQFTMAETAAANATSSDPLAFKEGSTNRLEGIRRSLKPLRDALTVGGDTITVRDIAELMRRYAVNDETLPRETQEIRRVLEEVLPRWWNAQLENFQAEVNKENHLIRFPLTLLADNLAFMKGLGIDVGSYVQQYEDFVRRNELFSNRSILIEGPDKFLERVQSLK